MSVNKPMFRNLKYMHYAPLVVFLMMASVSYLSAGERPIVSGAMYIYGSTRSASIIYLIAIVIASLAPIVHRKLPENIWILYIAVCITCFAIFQIEYSIALQVALYKLEQALVGYVANQGINYIWSAVLLFNCIWVLLLVGIRRDYFIVLNVVLIISAGTSAYNSYWSWLGLMK